MTKSGLPQALLGGAITGGKVSKHGSGGPVLSGGDHTHTHTNVCKLVDHVGLSPQGYRLLACFSLRSEDNTRYSTPGCKSVNCDIIFLY